MKLETAACGVALKHALVRLGTAVLDKQLPPDFLILFALDVAEDVDCSPCLPGSRPK